jgi:thymidylate synthase (FAD)
MTQKANIEWATPDIDNKIAYIARVSNPSNQDNPNITGLLQYMIKHGHVSPFEMANVCMEITTTRDIGRQILRHRSFSFQEFSQRYAAVDDLGEFVEREARLQDTKNRQNSLHTDNLQLQAFWQERQARVVREAKATYDWALANGIAKEQARAVLPEGLTPSKMYMNGTVRSWIFYLKQRLDPSTQKEHRELAEKVLEQLTIVAPVTFKAFFD